ncbi:MAG: S-methyl-5-thioribose-1-phosphate isomerase [Bacteroidota bacterium]
MSSSNRTIWPSPSEAGAIEIIDQRFLPHEWVIATLRSPEDAARAIKDMQVRGAPLIGATAGYGMYLACRHVQQTGMGQSYLEQMAKLLLSSRPTAVNLQWAVERQLLALSAAESPQQWVAISRKVADDIVEEDVETCRMIGVHGLPLMEAIAAKKQGPVQVLTHCNAGRTACVEWGTATSPIYQAHQAGIPLHVWVDETRPRNQGARITAWELADAGIPHTVIVDNAGGHLMQHGMVDLCLVGTDRTTRTGDVANKIGTYLKALAAHDNGVPFYVGLPASTIDWSISDGLTEIPIETRGAAEVTHMAGWDEVANARRVVRLTPPESPAINYGFDVTPAKYITGLITERGIAEANESSLLHLFPEYAQPV